MQSQFPRFKPQLAIIQAGARPDSSVYVRMKAKAADEVGIAFKHVHVSETAEVNEIVDIVKSLNEDDSVSGILVQLPLGSHVGAEGERTVTEAVSPEKDVDGCVHLRMHFMRGMFYVKVSRRRRARTTRDAAFVLHDHARHSLVYFCRVSDALFLASTHTTSVISRLVPQTPSLLHAHPLV